MACSYISLDDGQFFMQDILQLKKAPSLLNSSISSNSSLNNSQILEDSKSLIQLVRGGVICNTKIGPIQFGMPPETVKDSLNLGIEIPTYYIIPTNRFDKKFGISVAEFEFPAYFNFFVKQRQVALICTQEDEVAIRTVFQETLLGPKENSNIAKDFYYKIKQDSYPDFHKELSVFSTNPKNPQERLTIDHLLKFVLFDSVTNTAIIDNPLAKINIIKQKGSFKIIEDDVPINIIMDRVVLPQSYNEYIIINNDNERSKMENIPGQLNYKESSPCASPGIRSPGLRSQKLRSPRIRGIVSIEQQEQQSTKQKIVLLPLMKSQNNLDVISNPYDSQEQSPQFGCRVDEKKHSFLLWNGTEQANVLSFSNIGAVVEENEDVTFTPPDFGVTVLGCSHGFDPKGSTSGYIFWVNGRGIMVDPPPFASYHMKQKGIPSILICAVIISHCHADHDAGTFHKILDDTKVEIITTRTIMGSFLRKYSAISGMDSSNLRKLFTFRPVIIGTALNIYGANFEFFYSMHTIPSIGFRVSLENKSIYFSGDTFYDPVQLLEYRKSGILSQKRYEQLAFPSFNEDIILHEAGVPPIHTSQAVLAALPISVKNRMYLVHTAMKDLIKDSGLKIAKTGIENTMILIPPNTNKNISTLRRIDLLSSIKIFEHLTLKSIRWLLDSLSPEKFNPGEQILKEGSLGNKFYIIESGLAMLFSIQKGNEQNSIYIFLDSSDSIKQVITLESKLVFRRMGGEVHRKIQNNINRVEAVTKVSVLTLEKHDFWFIFGDGYDGQGPIINKLQKLQQSRKSQSIFVLFKNSVLSELTPSQKTQMEIMLTEQVVEKDQVLWSKGDMNHGFALLVKKGSFEFFDCPEANKEEMESGAYIGEANAMIEGSPMTTSLRATRNSTIFIIPKNELILFLENNPGLYMLFRDQKHID